MPVPKDASNEGAALRTEIDTKLLTEVAAEPATANTKELYKALSLVVREELAKRWVHTQVDDRKRKTRRIYYSTTPFPPWICANRPKQRFQPPTAPR